MNTDIEFSESITPIEDISVSADVVSRGVVSGICFHWLIIISEELSPEVEGSTCSASLNTENSLKKNREMKRKSQGHESLTVDYVSKGDVSPGMCIRKDFYRSVFQR